MGSRKIGLIGLWDQIGPELPVPNRYCIPNVCFKFFPLFLSIG